MSLRKQEIVCGFVPFPRELIQMLVNNSSFSRVSHSGTLSFPCFQRLQATNTVLLTDKLRRYRSAEHDGSYQCEAEEVHVQRSVSATVEPSGDKLWDTQTHFHTPPTAPPHPPTQTHPDTPMMQRLMQPPCSPQPSGLILVSNPSHNPINAVSHHCPAQARARPPATRRQ